MSSATSTKAITHRLLLDIATRYEERALTPEEDLELTRKAIDLASEDKLRSYVASQIPLMGVAGDTAFSPTPWGEAIAKEIMKKQGGGCTPGGGQ